MRVFVLNCGSSSVKFGLMEVADGVGTGDARAVRVELGGHVANVGGTASLHLASDYSPVPHAVRSGVNHGGAVRLIFEQLRGHRIDAVGHRVVHGGRLLRDPVRIDAEVMAAIERLGELAPLHNPAGLAGIREAREALGPDVPMVAVFDTAFFHDLPAVSAAYAIPQDLAAKHQIRRYGFHGTAHVSLADGYAALTGRPLDRVRLITLHLGNGCSATAIKSGRAVDTSMGFSPLEGLVMGTRSGDLDPAVVSYLTRREGVSADTVERWLNEGSGLLGLSGRSHDMGELLRLAGQDDAADFAIELFCYRIRKYLGAYLAALGGADAVVFGGGIGERAPEIRTRVCEGMNWCGLLLDPERNLKAQGLPPGGGACISPDGAPLSAYVVAVDEEAVIARETLQCLAKPGLH